MKDSTQSASAPAAAVEKPANDAGDSGRAREEFANRKLIRPSMPSRPGADHSERGDRRGNGKKPAPPEQTSAEAFYFQKQMQTRTPMVVVLNDGEELRGIIEWYDKDCIKLNRNAHQPNLLVYKSNIKYLFKQSENGKR